ncbi:MAG TPA: GntR family transcriptional regulator [Candidatus Elarobacter sp.]|jgi:DNA-binding GntR family transcriptional regulator|nr:GntR family transcriptional regulator [Candidatus Elarobacter sp.]
MAPVSKPESDADDRRGVGEVAAGLREAIAGGVYRPKERLVEEELARTFATNRAVIRGALAALQQEGLVTRERNRGAHVRLIESDEAIEILQARAVLEALVARRAAERIDDEGVASLRSIVERMGSCAASGDLMAYSELNAAFHGIVLRFGGDPTLQKLLAQLQSQSVRYQFRTVLAPGRPASSLAEHQAILAALAGHDPDAAERAARRHVESVIETVRSLGAHDRLH